MLTLDDVYAARDRISGSVRRTPTVRAAPARERLGRDIDVWLKLECLQVTGSFKARGAFSKLRALPDAAIKRGLVTASGGNHGIAVSYVAREAGVPARVFVPRGVSPAKARKIESYGAKLEKVGEVFDEANRAALEVARGGLTYVHPFDDPIIVAGQGTTALEILEDVADLDLLIVAIGGGGLIAGMALAAKSLRPSIRIIGVEPTGAPTMHAAFAAGGPIELPAITTKVPTLASKKTAPLVYEIARRDVDDIVLIEDSDMDVACRWLWREMNIAADPSGAASVAALLSGKLVPPAGAKVCALVCGAGPEGIDAA
jgi:threonine dehydratase